MAQDTPPPQPSYQELLAERDQLRREVERLTQGSFREWQVRRMAGLEEQRDQRLAHLLAAATSPQVSLDTVMELLAETARTISDHTVHAILYEIQPMTGKTLEWIKTYEDLDSLEDVSLEQVLFCKFDCKSDGGPGSQGCAINDLPISQRYLSLKRGTVVADTFLRRQPVVSIPSMGLRDRLEGAHYGHYDRARWSHVDQRAAFPLINPLSSQVEYVLVIDKGGEQLSNYDIRYVRDFVNLAAFALAIKKIMADDRVMLDHLRKGLHDLGSAMQSIRAIGGLLLDMLELDQPDTAKIKDYRRRLGWQFERFARLVEQLRSGDFKCDLEPQVLDAFLRRGLPPLAEPALFGSRLSLTLDLDAPEALVMMDAFTLQAALENMAKNTYETEKPARVVVTTRRQDDYVKLSYFDDCGGMDDKLYQSVIEHSKAPTTKAQGSGLGIHSILKSLRDMGCIVGAVNRPGVGFGYEVLIPLASLG